MSLYSLETHMNAISNMSKCLSISNVCLCYKGSRIHDYRPKGFPQHSNMLVCLYLPVIHTLQMGHFLIQLL